MNDEQVDQLLELVAPLMAEIKTGKLSGKYESRGFGKVACPVCQTGTIAYSVASHNKHTSGKCDGCWVQWQE